LPTIHRRRNPPAHTPERHPQERILILSAGVGAGHNTAAAAVKQAALARDDVEDVLVVDVLEQSSTLYRDLLGKGYVVLVENAVAGRLGVRRQ